jgi:hypothetical protein
METATLTDLTEEGEELVVFRQPDFQPLSVDDDLLPLLADHALSRWLGEPGPLLKILFEGEIDDFHPEEERLRDEVLRLMGLNRDEADDDLNDPLSELVGRILASTDQDFSDEERRSLREQSAWSDLPDSMPYRVLTAIWSQWTFPETQTYTLVRLPHRDALAVCVDGRQGGPVVYAVGPIRPDQPILDTVRQAVVGAWEDIPGTTDEECGPPTSIEDSDLLPRSVVWEWEEEYLRRRELESRCDDEE